MYSHRKRLLDMELKKPKQGQSEANLEAYKTLHE